MCGLAGYVCEAPVNGAAMVESLRHRGPDSSGELQENIAGRHVFLGHTRLSIIDLSAAGRQPMTSLDGGVSIVFNGEIYNFETLRSRYLKNHAFRSRTDTEVLLNLYCELGPDFVELLNGDFAFVLLDRRVKKLFLVRDRLGIKPLYIYEGPGVVAFGSEIKAFEAAGLPLTISDDSVRRFFVFKYVPKNDTMYDQVKRIGPGTCLTVDIESGHKEVRQYWSLPPVGNQGALDIEECEFQLRTLLEEAISGQLIADVPVGTFLSGGLDSSTIAYFVRDNDQLRHYCARKTREDLQREGTTSDYAFAKRLADQWGLDFRVADIDADTASREAILRTVHFSDDLIADGSQIPTDLIAAAAGRDCRVMLSGMGGDELFLGYAGHILTLFAEYLDRAPSTVSRPVSRLMSSLDQGNGALKAYRRWLHKFGKYYGRGDNRPGMYSIVGDFDNSMAVCGNSRQSTETVLDSYFSAASNPFAALTRFEMENFLVKNLHYFDRMCMANSVEGRVPLLDYRIVEFAVSLPRQYKLSARGETKRLLKRAMRGLVPDYVIGRRKAGFGMPLRSILREQAKLDDLVDLDFFHGSNLFHVDRIRDIVASHVDGREDNSSIIYALVTYQLWRQRSGQKLAA